MNIPTLILLAACSYAQLNTNRLSTSEFARVTEAPVTASCGTCYFIPESTVVTTNFDIFYSSSGNSSATTNYYISYVAFTAYSLMFATWERRSCFTTILSGRPDVPPFSVYVPADRDSDSIFTSSASSAYYNFLAPAFDIPCSNAPPGFTNNVNASSTGQCIPGCTVSAAYQLTTVSDAPNAGLKSAGGPSSNVYLVFSSYHITSTFLFSGTCVTSTPFGMAVTPSLPISVSSPPRINETVLGPEALTSYVSSLRLTGCTPSPIPPPRTPAVTAMWEPITAADSVGFPSLSTVPPTSSLLGASPTSRPHNASSPNTASAGLENKDKIAIGVVVPVTVFALTLLGMLTWRKRKSPTIEAIHAESSQGAHPYLLQNGELEAEERTTNELGGRLRTLEADGTNEIYQMPTGIDNHRTSAIQELRGPEHVSELEVHG